jgi:hypothetical protein
LRSADLAPFHGAGFSGGAVSFGSVEFSGGTVSFHGAAFSVAAFIRTLSA